MPSRILPAVWVLGLFAATVSLEGAENAAARRASEQLFSAGWSNAYEARARLDAAWAALAAGEQADARVIYAHALTLLQQNRVTPAAELLVALTTAAEKKADTPPDANRLQQWRARVWLAMLQKKYAAAAVDAETLARLVAAASSNPAHGELCGELAAFLGRMHGFLAGPAASGLPEGERAAHRKKTSETLPAELRPAFETAAAEVVAAFQNRSEEKLARQTAAVEAEETAKEKQRADLERDDQRIVRRREELQPLLDKLRSEFRAHTADLERSDAPLQAELDRVRAEGAVVIRELNTLEFEIGRVGALLLRERDPVLRENYRRELGRLESIAARYQSEVNLLQRAADRLKIQRAELQRKYAQLEAQFGGELKKVEGEIAALDAQQKKNLGLAARLRRPASGDSAKTAGLALAALALTTYDSFPLEAERQRLLVDLAP